MIKIGGLQKLTLIDYPKKTACTVFLSGCNFRCPWCYSPELVLPEKIEKHPQISTEEFFLFRKERVGKLEGVVICGGEPTVYKKLPEFCKKIKDMGFLVKIDTNGSNPEMLSSLIEKGLVDYIAMDIKLPLSRYHEVYENTENIKKSIDLTKNSSPDYEFRTTVVPDVHQKEDIEEIARSIKGARRYFLQNFRPEKTIDQGFLQKKPFSKEEMLSFAEKAKPFVKLCEIR